LFCPEWREADFKVVFIVIQPVRDRARHHGRRVDLLECTLPNNSHSPLLAYELITIAAITCNVRFELGFPEIRTRDRIGSKRAAWVPMPEAAVNEYRAPCSREHDVRFPRKVFSVKPEAQTTSMKRPSQSEFWLGMLTSYSRHHPGTGCFIHDVSHFRPGLSART